MIAKIHQSAVTRQPTFGNVLKKAKYMKSVIIECDPCLEIEFSTQLADTLYSCRHYNKALKMYEVVL